MLSGVRGGSRRTRGAAALLLAAIVAVGFGGCATYTDKTTGASLAAGIGDYPVAIARLTGLLGVSTADQVPPSINGDKPLLLLDRGVLQQATARFEASRRDLSAAEQKLELLDIGKNPVAALGSYLYSDSVKTYKTPPVERLSLNAINMLNYVGRGDLSGAAVEARRFQVMRDYLDSIQVRSPAPDRLGAYLAGFVFEQSGEGDRALRYYDEAVADGPAGSLTLPIARLARLYPYRGKNVSRVLGAGGGRGGRGGGAAKATGGAIAAKPPELLVVLALGRVPHKVPQRIAVGAAVGVAAAFLGDQDLDVLKYSASKVLVYPELVATPSSLGAPTVRVNGNEVQLELLADLGAAVAMEYQAAKPKILAAALARVASRAAVSEGVRAAGNQDSQALGDVLSILVEATMVALDKPDTRSWQMLPERVLVARVPVSPGIQDVAVSFRGGGGRTARVDVAEKGWGVVVVTEPR